MSRNSRRRAGRTFRTCLRSRSPSLTGASFVFGNKARRQAQKRADCLLPYTGDFSIAVVEAKAASLPATFYRRLCVALGLQSSATAAGVFYAVANLVEDLVRERVHRSSSATKLTC